LRLGLLIFGTKTHPVTVNIRIDRSIRFRRPIVERGVDVEPITLEVVVVAKDYHDNRKTMPYARICTLR
jgi:hypothetical protein